MEMRVGVGMGVHVEVEQKLIWKWNGSESENRSWCGMGVESELVWEKYEWGDWSNNGKYG